jgi:endonuclease YncB( thermonuclease family)
VIDGDTLIFSVWDRLPVHVRLTQCWAAEVGRAKTEAEKRFGLQAKQRLQALAEGSRGVLLVATGEADDLSDVLTLDRVLGQVWTTAFVNADLSELMRAEKLAFRTKAELQAHLKGLAGD